MANAKPTTLGELQLYKVLQRANLLSYYDAFISQGGDDVQQLCEAGEEEFLEIMALVGMASKPLHVRRLQKALQEWVTRPSVFRGTNIHYLPSQSISLTSLGIDTRDLILPPQTSPHNSASPNFPRDSLDGNLISRPLNANGTSNTPRSSKGANNVFRLDDDNQQNADGELGNTGSMDSERISDSITTAVLDTIVQKYLKSPLTLLEKKDAIAQLKADRSLRDVAAAIENDDQNKMEALIRNYIRVIQASESGSKSKTNHEVLVIDGGVKLCMADERWLLKKNELLANAEKIANETESKLPGRRRSSTHLHGSCSQSRLQEVNQRLQNIKSQRTNLHKKLAEAQANKNVIKENECQNVLTQITQDEVILLQEKQELSEKLITDNRDVTSTTSGMDSSFSSELADLAKAHNLSFGNLQSMPSSSSCDGTSGIQNNRINGIANTIKGNGTSCSPRASPPSSGNDVSNINTGDLLHIKREGGEEVAFPSNGAARASKRKLSSGNSSTASSVNKKFITSSEASID